MLRMFMKRKEHIVQGFFLGEGANLVIDRDHDLFLGNPEEVTVAIMGGHHEGHLPVKEDSVHRWLKRWEQSDDAQDAYSAGAALALIRNMIDEYESLAESDLTLNESDK